MPRSPKSLSAKSATPKASSEKTPKKNSRERVLDRLFAVHGPARRSASMLPEVVLQNRRARARQRITEALGSRGEDTLDGARQQELEELIRRWQEHDFADGFAGAESFEIRCAEEAERHAAAQAGTGQDALAERQYRRSVVERYGSIEIRGLQMSARVHQSLDMAYVPLHLADPGQERTVTVSEGVEIRDVPRVRAEALLKRYRRVLIVGEPGSGKTTLVSYLAARVAAGTLEEVGWKEDPVPFVVPVRSLPEPRVDEETIAQGAGCTAALVRQALCERRAFVCFDGIDEAPGATTAPLLAAIAAFADAHPDVRILATSRPAGVPGGEGAKVQGFATAKLLAMTRDEIDVFIDRWCHAAERSMQKDERKADVDARRAAEDLKGRVHTSPPVERLAETPLVCTILCVVHRFLGQRIPERRAALYEACTNVLLYEWDRAKFPEGATIGRLDAQQKRYLLGDLARSMHEQGTAEIAEDALIARFAAKLPDLGSNPVEAGSMVVEIRDRSGILVERRPGFFGFSHLTFQEYLTAVDVARNGDVTALAERHADPWWHEVIVLCAGLPSIDASGLVSALLLADGEDIATGTLLAAQCLETSIDLPPSLREQVESKLRALVPPKNDSDVARLVTFGGLAGPVLMRSLPEANRRQRVYAAIVLGEIKYEPATKAITQIAEDERPLAKAISIPVPLGGMSLNVVSSVPYTFGLLALINLALSSRVAVAALIGIARKHSRPAMSLPSIISILKRTARLEGLQSLADRLQPLLPPRPTSAKPRAKRDAHSR